MDENVVVPQINDPVLPPLPTVVPPKKSKALKLSAVFAVILVLLAVGLSMLCGGKNNVPTDTSNPKDDNVADNIYRNSEYFYELTLPPKWEAMPIAADTQMMNFTTSGDAMLSVKVNQKLGSLEEYLSMTDALSKQLKVNKSYPIKVGIYDGTERSETWMASGTQVTSAYSKIQDMVYSFTLLPTEGKSAVTNESVIREYKSVLTSFRITSTKTLGKDWIEYASPATDTSLSKFAIWYPQNWKMTEFNERGVLVLKIFKDDYQIELEQGPFDGGVCLFDDSPNIDRQDERVVLTEDLRQKTYSVLSTDEGIQMRRYFKNNVGDKSVLAFCMKSSTDTQYESIWKYGQLTYRVPAKYDNDILLEMDTIVKTIKGASNE